MDHKSYLGDAVYADFDGYHIVLTTENGLGTTNTIALEPPVLDRLLKYVEELKKASNSDTQERTFIK